MLRHLPKQDQMNLANLCLAPDDNRGGSLRSVQRNAKEFEERRMTFPHRRYKLDLLVRVPEEGIDETIPEISDKLYKARMKQIKPLDRTELGELFYVENRDKYFWLLTHTRAADDIVPIGSTFTIHTEASYPVRAFYPTSRDIMAQVPEDLLPHVKAYETYYFKDGENKDIGITTWYGKKGSAEAGKEFLKFEEVPEVKGKKYLSPKQYDGMDERFEETVYVVRATDEEKGMLRKFYSNENFWRERYFTGDTARVNWRDDSMGTGASPGSLGDMDTMIMHSWAEIGGKKVVFWEATSVRTDSELSERFMKEVDIPLAKGRHISANEFSECLNYCTGGKRYEPLSKLLPETGRQIDLKAEPVNAEKNLPEKNILNGVKGLYGASELMQRFLMAEYTELTQGGQFEHLNSVRYQTGKVAGQPIIVEFNVYNTGGNKLGFYHPVSSSVDYDLVEGWISKNFKAKSFETKSSVKDITDISSLEKLA